MKTREEILKQFQADVQNKFAAHSIESRFINEIYEDLDFALIKALDSVEQQQPYISQEQVREIYLWLMDVSTPLYSSEILYEAFSARFPHLTTPPKTKDKSENPTNLVTEQERREMAAKAMQGLLSNSAYMRKTSNGEKYLMRDGVIAEVAVAYTDALIAELAKSQEGKG